MGFNSISWLGKASASEHDILYYLWMVTFMLPLFVSPPFSCWNSILVVLHLFIHGSILRIDILGPKDKRRRQLVEKKVFSCLNMQRFCLQLNPIVIVVFIPNIISQIILLMFIFSNQIVNTFVQDCIHIVSSPLHSGECMLYSLLSAWRWLPLSCLQRCQNDCI